MPRRRMKGGDGLFEDAALIGMGAYAARQPGGDSLGGLMANVFKIGLYLLAAIVGIILLVLLIGWLTSKKQHFTVPEKPSKEGDEKLMTPAGNVIVY